MDEGFGEEGPQVGYEGLGNLLVRAAMEREGLSGNWSADHGSVERAISRRIEQYTGRRFDLLEIRDYLHGVRQPEPRFVADFAAAYSLTVRERRSIAWAYTFSEVPHPQTLNSPPPIDGGL